MDEGADKLTWNEIKQSGSQHYKTGEVEPIDLYKAGGFLQGYCVASIIKYAYRNRGEKINPVDMGKIKHLAEMMIALAEERQKGADGTPSI